MKNKTDDESIVLSHKIKIKPVDDTWSDFKMIFRDLQDETSRAENSSVLIQWAYDSSSDVAKDMLNEKISIDDIDEDAKTLVTYMNRKNKLKFNNANGEVIEQARRDALVKYKINKNKMDKHEGFIPGFGSNQPIIVKNTAFKIYKEKSKYYVDARILSEEYAEKLNKGINYKISYKTKDGKKKEKKISYGRSITGVRMKFELAFGRKDMRSKEILDRCIAGEYVQGTSKFLKKVKGEWMFCLSFHSPIEEKEEDKFIKGRVMGIDMGIVYPIYMAFNDSYKKEFIGGGEIKKFRTNIEARRNSMLSQGKYCGSGRNGRGVKNKIKPIEKLSGRIENFKTSTNHKYSKFVIETALKNKCGVIQMEDLSGIADGEKKGSFLGTWTYYDLQEKIEYKAKMHGIKVKSIKPDYTSARCNKCGYIHSKENKDKWRPKQNRFICQNCDFGHKFFVNADLNAAKNIAMVGIEKIIEEQLKFQKELVHS